MKPVISILGLGFDTLDKLSLAAYRTLSRSNPVFVLSSDHPVVMDMIKEGLLCVEIFPKENMYADNSEELASQIADRILAYPSEIYNASVTLPGNPLREGKLVTKLQQKLSPVFEVNLDFLAADNSLERLLEIMAELRSPTGCIWDKEQTHQTLKKYLIEETYEVIEAIETGNMNNFCEELGDLLLQVVFHSQIAKEAGQFSFPDVLKGISDKMIRRHPHVFSTTQVKTSEDVLVNWDNIKKKEKSEIQNASEKQDFFDLPKGLPALQFAEDTQKKAAGVGFDWRDYHGPLAKVYEELAEMEKEFGNNRRLQIELGDLLFSIVNLSRFLDLNAEEALRQSTRKFQARFNKVLAKIQQEGFDPQKMSMEQIDSYWEQVKSEEKMVQ